ncbi:MAG: hypothetical protein ACFB51_13515 [Anaerolineae bacterium]
MEVDPNLVAFAPVIVILFCITPLITVPITIWVVYMSQAQNAEDEAN